MDGGRDLAKAIELLEEEGYALPVIGDLSHVIANSLKNAYGNHPQFDAFTSACSHISGKIKQTALACLAPPKVSTKARFMNLHRLVCWADMLLDHSPQGRAKQGSKLAKLRQVMGELKQCKAFIQKFKHDAEILLSLQKSLKESGLTFQGVRQAQVQIKGLNSVSVRKDLEEWLDSHLQLAKDLGFADTGLPITSDPIESLFGRAKQHGAGPIKDANQITKRIHALCGPVTAEDAQSVLDISCAQEQEILGNTTSLTKQRRQVLPHPGRLEELSKEEADSLELISEAKKQEKSFKYQNNSNDYEKMDRTPFCLGKQHLAPVMN
jgi:hypothetical protein